MSTCVRDRFAVLPTKKACLDTNAFFRKRLLSAHPPFLTLLQRLPVFAGRQAGLLFEIIGEIGIVRESGSVGDFRARERRGGEHIPEAVLTLKFPYDPPQHCRVGDDIKNPHIRKKAVLARDLPVLRGIGKAPERLALMVSTL